MDKSCVSLHGMFKGMSTMLGSVLISRTYVLSKPHACICAHFQGCHDLLPNGTSSWPDERSMRSQLACCGPGSISDSYRLFRDLLCPRP